ncbi:MAG: hypothetical protein LBC27_09560 [Spirochaetaceae bacterium]|nr:hypothetical protein [Spirochaetaceae bacterium]
MKKKLYVLHIFFISGLLFAESGRGVEELFPNINEVVLKKARASAYSNSINVNNAAKTALTIKPVDGISVERAGFNPAYIIENLLILKEKDDKYVSKLDIYNALCKIHTLRGREYFSSTRGKRTVLFEEASRIAGKNDLKKQNDPPPALSVPKSETIFIMVQDVNFGNCYYRAEIKTDGGGIWYSLTNFKSINYLFIPIIKAENLFIQLYIESIKEGVLIYGLTCVNAADFADKRADIPSTIQKRLDLIYGWIGDNIGLVR